MTPCDYRVTYHPCKLMIIPWILEGEYCSVDVDCLLEWWCHGAASAWPTKMLWLDYQSHRRSVTLAMLQQDVCLLMFLECCMSRWVCKVDLMKHDAMCHVRKRYLIQSCSRVVWFSLSWCWCAFSKDVKEILPSPKILTQGMVGKSTTTHFEFWPKASKQIQTNVFG